MKKIAVQLLVIICLPLVGMRTMAGMTHDLCDDLIGRLDDFINEMGY